MKIKSHLLTFLCFSFTYFSVSFCDTVLLYNQDRIQGDIIELKEGVLSFHSPYLKECLIAWDQVHSLQSHDFFYITLLDHSTIRARFTASNKNSWSLQTLDRQTLNTQPHHILSISKEKPQKDTTQWNWDGKITGSLSKKYGNSQSFLSNVCFQQTGSFYEKQELSNQIYLEANYAYKGNPNEQEDEKSGDAQLLFKRRLCPKTFYFLSEKLSFDSSKELIIKTIETLGLSHPIFKNTCFLFDFHFGLSRVDSSFKAPKGHEGNFSLNLGSFWLYKLSADFDLSQDTMYLPSLSNFSLYTLEIKSTLSFKKSAPWIVELQHKWDYISRPQDGKKNSDQAVSLNFGYIF